MSLAGAFEGNLLKVKNCNSSLSQKCIFVIVKDPKLTVQIFYGELFLKSLNRNYLTCWRYICERPQFGEIEFIF